MWGEDVNICYIAKSDKYLFLADFFSTCLWNTNLFAKHWNDWWED